MIFAHLFVQYKNNIIFKFKLVILIFFIKCKITIKKIEFVDSSNQKDDNPIPSIVMKV